MKVREWYVDGLQFVADLTKRRIYDFWENHSGVHCGRWITLWEPKNDIFNLKLFNLTIFDLDKDKLSIFYNLIFDEEANMHHNWNEDILIVIGLMHYCHIVRKQYA